MLVYHCTYDRHVESICETGIRRSKYAGFGREPATFFVTDFEDALLTARKWIGSPGAIFEIELTAQELLESMRDNHHDEDFGTVSARYVPYDIPVDKLKTAYFFDAGFTKEPEIHGVRLLT